MKLLSNSLEAKTLALVTALTVTVFAVLFLVNSHWQRTNTMSQIDSVGQRVSDLLFMAREGPMMVGDDKGTREQFQKVADLYAGVTVYLRDFQGNITYSTQEGSIRKRLTAVRGQPEVKAILEQALRMGHVSRGSSESPH